ncbi:unnamed protein product [Cochlearia groenlandica]
MSLLRCSSLRSVLNTRRYRSSYASLLPLHTLRKEDATITRSFSETRSYHSFIHRRNQTPLINGAFSFESPTMMNRSISTFGFGGSSGGSVELVADWVLKSAVSNVYALNNVADAFASLQHFIALLHSFTFSQWWVCIIVVSLLIRGVTIPVMVDLINSIAHFLKSLGSHTPSAQGEILDKVSLFSKSRSLMYTMLEKE